MRPTTIISTMIALSILTILNALFLVPVEAFVAAPSVKQHPSSFTVLRDAGESEWYSPPPATAVEKRPRGTAPSETVVNSAEDLCSFLFDRDDGRLAIVKYHAAWYVENYLESIWHSRCVSPDSNLSPGLLTRSFFLLFTTGANRVPVLVCDWTN